MAMTYQPRSYEPSDFQTGLCECFDDIGTCCYGWCCYCMLGQSIARDMDECLMCGNSMAMRSVYRTRYNINGSLCNDYLAVGFCPCCSACQLKRDIERRKAQGIF